MKKMLMGMLAMLLVLTMGTTVFAANSPGTDAALNQKAQEWVDLLLIKMCTFVLINKT